MLDDEEFSRLALATNLLSPLSLREIEELAAIRRVPRVTMALQTGAVNEGRLLTAVARTMGMVYRDLQADPPPRAWLHRLPLRLMRAQQVIALGPASPPNQGSVLLGMVDPLNVDALENASKLLQASVVPVLIGPKALGACLEQLMAEEENLQSGAYRAASGSYRVASGDFPAITQTTSRNFPTGPVDAVPRPRNPGQGLHRDTGAFDELPPGDSRQDPRTTKNVAIGGAPLPPPQDALADLFDAHGGSRLQRAIVRCLVEKRILTIADLERAIADE